MSSIHSDHQCFNCVIEKGRHSQGYKEKSCTVNNITAENNVDASKTVKDCYNKILQGNMFAVKFLCSNVLVDF